MKIYTRLSMDFSPEAIAQLDEIADVLHVSRGEVIRKALGLMRFAVQERGRGARLIVKGPECGRRRQIDEF